MQAHAADQLLRACGINSPVRSIQSLSGGTHQAWRVEAGGDALFVKTSERADAARLFACEAEGLAALRKHAKDFRIPETLHHNERYLVLEYIEHGRSSEKSQEWAGQALAKLHRSTSSVFFGWEEDNFIGPLPQANGACGNWTEFFLEQRIKPLLAKAGSHFPPAEAMEMLQKIEAAVAASPPTKASMLHGDLWSGNLFFDGEGAPVLIDPAVYFGCREVDLSMTTLFGGFSEAFYKAYQKEWAPEPAWEARIPLWNLYPTLVHVNLFGGHYVDEFRRSVTLVSERLP